MSKLLNLFCGYCGSLEAFPKSSISTDYSLKSNQKLNLPITSRNTKKSRFNINIAKNNEIFILEKSIFRILSRVTHSFFNKKGKIKPKKSLFESFKRGSKINLESINQSPKKYTKKMEQENLLLNFDAKILANYEDGLLINEAALKDFFEIFSPSNLIIYYTSSHYPELVAQKLFEKFEFGIEILWGNRLQKNNTNFKNSNEIIFSEPLKSVKINADLVIINLLDFEEFQYDPAKRQTFLDEETRKKMCKFIEETLNQTKKCAIIIPPETFVEDFAEIFDLVLFDENLQMKFGNYILEMEGVYYENELEFIVLTFDEKNKLVIKEQIDYLVGCLFDFLNNMEEKKEISQIFYQIILKIGLRKTLHYIYEAEIKQKNGHKIMLLKYFLNTIICENLLDEQIYFALFQSRFFISNHEFFEEELNMIKTRSFSKESPVLRSSSNAYSIKKEDVSHKMKGSLLCSPKPYENSFEMSPNSQFSEYSIQKSSNKNLDCCFSLERKGEMENIFVNIQE